MQLSELSGSHNKDMRNNVQCTHNPQVSFLLVNLSGHEMVGHLYRWILSGEYNNNAQNIFLLHMEEPPSHLRILHFLC